MNFQQTAKHLRRCLPPLYILQLEDKTQKLVDVKRWVFFLTIGPCYFTALAIRNTRKIWKQPNYYAGYLKAKEKLWKHTSYFPSAESMEGFGRQKKKEQVQFTSLLSIGTHIRMTLVCFFLSHLLVKYRIKYPNHQGTKKFRSRVTIEKDFACDCFLTNATPPFGINVKQSGQYFEFQQLKKKTFRHTELFS